MRGGSIPATVVVALLLVGPLEVRAVSLTATLDVAQATTANPGASGSGFADLMLNEDTSELSWIINFSGLTGTENNAHFHGPAVPGMIAGVQVPLPPGSPKSGSATLEPEQVSQLLAGLWYINIHSTHSPGGEIRGQVLAVPEPATLLLLALGSGALVVLRKRSQA